jgi:hypothetical protein
MFVGIFVGIGVGVCFTAVVPDTPVAPDASVRAFGGLSIVFWIFSAKFWAEAASVSVCVMSSLLVIPGADLIVGSGIPWNLALITLRLLVICAGSAAVDFAVSMTLELLLSPEAVTSALAVCRRLPPAAADVLPAFSVINTLIVFSEMPTKIVT